MSNFDESKINRARDGKFAAKIAGTPVVRLNADNEIQTVKNAGVKALKANNRAFAGRIFEEAHKVVPDRRSFEVYGNKVHLGEGGSWADADIYQRCRGPWKHPEVFSVDENYDDCDYELYAPPQKAVRCDVQEAQQKADELYNKFVDSASFLTHKKAVDLSHQFPDGKRVYIADGFRVHNKDDQVVDPGSGPFIDPAVIGDMDSSFINYDETKEPYIDLDTLREREKYEPLPGQLALFR
ncbi:hypothetical protein [Actinomyces vulturis]|uniref:hypothetical protein n=1 Tax=Actinomyces vulturis TaxID=1857645 RepID=UPI0008329379|nr:hypothetical protein [Actinomyces vulturis]